MSTTVLEAPTFAAAQWLMDHSRGQGLIVSCYADTSVAGVRSLWREHLAHEVRRIEGQMGDDPEARRALARDMEVVRAILSGPAAKQAKGMAVFVNVDRDFARTYPLDTPVANRLVVDEEIYIVPLLEYLHRQRRYLVVHTDSHHGVLYTASRGPLRRIEEITESVPRLHAASGQPYCQAACQTVNLWQEIALLATRHGIAVHFVEPEAGLDACGGVVAVLTRAHPWDPLPMPPTGATVGSARP